MSQDTKELKLAVLIDADNVPEVGKVFYWNMQSHQFNNTVIPLEKTLRIQR